MQLWIDQPLTWGSASERSDPAQEWARHRQDLIDDLERQRG
jgi:hypothetical protein